MKEIKITKQEEGQRLDRYLKKYLPEASSGFIHKMLRKKNITLNETKASGGEKLKEQDSIRIFFSEETLKKFMGNSGERAKEKKTKAESEYRSQIKVLYQDENVILLHKPAGLLTQKAEIGDDSLNDYLLDYCLEQNILTKEAVRTFRPAAVNRLDRNTSGIVLAGLTTRGLQELSELLKKRTLDKYYLCLVKGFMKGEKTLKGFLTKDREKNKVSFSREKKEGSVPILTKYSVLDANEEASLLKIELVTGKSHQIRAHLASQGHPVLGDYKYGDRNFNQRAKKACGIQTQMLHSYEVRFPEIKAGVLSPLQGKTITAPPPREFEKAMRWLKLSLKNAGENHRR